MNTLVQGTKFGIEQHYLTGIAYIPLTQGQFAIVDVEDYEYLMQWKWCAQWAEDNQSFYAGRGDGIRMHRELLYLQKGDGLVGDHINLNTLDNRRNNLRIAPNGANNRNTKKRKHNTSGFRGVHWHSQAKKWKTQINCAGTRIHLGLFKTPEAAFEAYKFATIALFGEFAYVEVA